MIEMLMVLAIIGTLLAISLPMLQTALDKARITRAIGDIGALQIDIATFEAAGKGLPLSLADIGRSDLLDPWGAPYRYLNFGCEAGAGGGGGGGGGGQGKGGGGGGGGNCENPKGARMDRFLHPLNSTYDLYSMGKDGNTVLALTAKASKDDIIRADDGGFIGLAVKY